MSGPGHLRLTLFVPGIHAVHPPAFSDCADRAGMPLALARFLARADSQTVAETGLEPRLFRLFGIHAAQNQDLPVAAVTRVTDMGVVDQEWWLRADPVNLTATRNGLVLRAGLNLQQSEAAQLVAELNEALAQDGWLLKAPRPERWYLKPPMAPSITTTPLDRAIGHDVHRLLPQGGDHKAWHTHLNEFQILMHTSPVNAAREERGDLPANSVWFWGGGRLPAIGKAVWEQVSCTDPLSQGLARLSHIPCSTVPADANLWLQAVTPAGDHLVVLEGLNEQYSENVPQSGRPSGLEWLNRQWLSPILDAVHGGKIAEFILLSDSGPALRYRRRHRWRFWRRSRPLDTSQAA